MTESTETESPTQAEKLLAHTWTGMQIRWNACWVFKKLAIEGLPLARGKFIAKKKSGILKKPEAAELDDEEIRRIAKSLAEYDEKTAKRAINAASLVFAHAILDGAAYGFCKVLMLVKPDAWISIEQRRLFRSHKRTKQYIAAFEIQGLVVVQRILPR